MKLSVLRSRAVVVALLAAAVAAARAQAPLAGAQPLTMTGDLSAQMVAGIHRFLDAETAASVGGREQLWHVDFSSPEAYERSVAMERTRFTKIIGAIDSTVPHPEFEFIATSTHPAKIAETDRMVVYAVRWPVVQSSLGDISGEGLLLQPKGGAMARVVALPDADQTPEMIAGLAPGLSPERQYARRLAENGCEVIVPTLIDRSDRFSGSRVAGRTTNQPHREWIYRQAFELGRHVIGYEVLKVTAAVTALRDRKDSPRRPIGVVGWGEGGLIALAAAARHGHIEVVGVSGYFGPRERVWEEPIYRNVFGLLRHFGDAEIARLIVPRVLMVEHSPAPVVTGPPTPRSGFSGAAPGRITTPETRAVRAEVDRARRLAGPFASAIELTEGGPFSDETLERFLGRLLHQERKVSAPGAQPMDTRTAFDPVERQRRQVDELQRFTQALLPRMHLVRDQFFWDNLPAAEPAAWREKTAEFRHLLGEEVIGRFPRAPQPLNPRTRPIIDQPAWTGHEVVLDVWPDVFAWGYLLLPKDLKPGEKRPVVVAQHGLEGLPADVINEDPRSRAFAAYKAFAARLAERGFIVFAPHNPYRGEEAFRLLQRKANPLGKSLFSIILAQHEAILKWLATQPNVDPARIGFYGLSYGGKTAMRVPALLEGYALSICSADFNEWIWKNVTTDWRGSYMFTKEWEMPEFNLGGTFGYAEMAALIAPRPFMVERGHNDGVGIDEVGSPGTELEFAL